MSDDGALYSVGPPVSSPVIHPPIVTLKRRAEFLRLRGGRRSAQPAFVVETKARGDAAAAAVSGPRFGFTVTKALGSAVTRNRIRRRLKAACRDAAFGRAHPEFDYVVIARAPAHDVPFNELVRQMERALDSVHRSGRDEPSPGTAKPPVTASPGPHSRAKP